MSTVTPHRPARGSAPAGGQRPQPGAARLAPVPVQPRAWSLRLPAGWPLSALFVLYPLWWALGVSSFVFVIFAVPMLVQLRRRGPVLVPPGFGLWLVLLLWVLLSALMLDLTAPNTLPASGDGRYIGWGIRLANYLAMTVVMLYVLNLRERELPQRRVVRLFGFMAVVVVIGGYLGSLFPTFSFVAPLHFVLPHSIASQPFVASLMQVEFAQVQQVLAGEASSPRPSAPFEYTNSWGENTAILLIWLLVGWVVLGRPVRRLLGIAIALAAVFPIIYSLNRGLWIGLGISAVYVAIRLALRGRMAVLGGLALAVGLIGILVIATPLGRTFDERLQNGHSDDIRTTLSEGAIAAANHSPVLGYGGNRALIGSNRSIAIGKSDDCKQCGNRELGSNGQLWALLVGQGYVGAFCYSAFFLYCLWRFRHDHSAIGVAGSLVVILMLFFQFTYGALEATLAYGLISVALLARNDRLRRAVAPAPPRSTVGGLRARIEAAGDR
ncbi:MULTISPECIES: O-antigen ligase [Micromonospora]|uniref:O-antigen ligase domain-containing protein n=1 Tax=Micromonospora sicca TaxID=2202420 RepID=A0A317DT28_9ACTN|nr:MULTISPECIES: O-antigen ligase family protein [unclassified Micromonospora]MBM0226826.1 O-antigen ligase domain-containing protein [Micromonospora sp. ATA51]PWR17200.1 O-antigen ligase domain-containing protein [Micromonospora sp. 4G51]